MGAQGFQRRGVIAALLSSCACRGTASAKASSRALIDIHHHIAPPSYAAFQVERGLFPPGLRGLTPGKAVEDMDRAGVEKAFTSITSPGFELAGREGAIRLARECNEYAARLAGHFPRRFGIFAALPLPDVEGSMTEAVYALDTLGAAGIQMWTNCAGKWFGDRAFWPVLAELNRRRAVIYVHPKSAPCCAGLLPSVTDAVVEYGADTTRAIANFLFNGAATAFPNLRVIFSHGGGTMPYLLDRFMIQADSGSTRMSRQDVLDAVRRFHYETAQVAQRASLLALHEVATSANILFGSDYPYRDIALQAQSLASSRVFSRAELSQVARGNALKLFNEGRWERRSSLDENPRLGLNDRVVTASTCDRLG